MLEVRNVSHGFGRTRVLHDINFSVQQGEILGFLGPNGAGKSTTMRILTGFLSPDSGRVVFDGKDIEKDPYALRRHLGYLPETVNLYPELTVGEYLNWVARMKKSTKPAKAAEEVAESCGLTKVGKMLIRHLSKGYKQRVGLAQAILGPTRLLILDEPTVGLDPEQISDIRQLIKNLGRDKTIILSTHILPEVELACNRVLIINKGRIVAEDTPMNLKRKTGGRYLLRLGIEWADAQFAAEHFESLSFVKNVSTQPESAENREGVVFIIETYAQEDRRAEVARQAVEKNLPVLEFKPADSLEQVFINLIRDENSPAYVTAAHGREV